ncbi:MAG: IS110 family transposase, partial [Akkermansiaceae bacterium]
LGDLKHAICVLDPNGQIIEERMISNNEESLHRLSKKYPAAKLAMEVGIHSPWISRYMKSLEHHVIVANARKLRAIYQSDRKSDRRDAQMLAKLARVDETLF